MTSKNFLYRLKMGVPEISQEISGGNSSVFKGQLPNGTILAIKEYKGDQLRIERMLSREERAITFLREHGLENIPEILEVRRDLGLIVYQWIEGNAPLANYDSMSAIIEMSNSLQEIYNEKFPFENAVDAAFSIRDVRSQIIERVDKFINVRSSVPARRLAELFQEALLKYESKYPLDLEFTRITLSISDLGIHNILEYRGVYNFIDFEFFGKDSVTKLVGDFVLHPQNVFDGAEIKRFISSITHQTQWDSKDLEVAMPILSLKWAAIAFGRTLNEMDRNVSNDTHHIFSAESNGMKYLTYFEFLISMQRTSNITTFRQYADTL